MFSEKKKPAIGWAFYDFASSAFTTTMLTVVFSVYFAKKLVPPEGIQIFGTAYDGTSLWGFLNSAVMAIVLLLSPPLGAYAEIRRSKKRFLLMTAALGGIATIALGRARPGQFIEGAALAFVAIVFYELSLVFYNATLKDVSDMSNSGRVSGLGYALGYIGGGLCLALNLWMISSPSTFGLSSENDPSLPVRACFVMVGVWWLLFSIPTWRWLPGEPPAPKSAAVREALARIFRLLKEMMARKSTRFFIPAYLIYNDAIQTILVMAALFGHDAAGMNEKDLAMCYLVIQFVAFVGAWISGNLADRWSHKKVIAITLVVYIGVTLWALFINTRAEFWALGVIVGLVLGGSQAASRSLFANLTPPESAGDYFGVFSVVGKAASLMGPLVFGVMNHKFGLRAAVASLAVFFIAGLLLLLPVEEPASKA